MRVQKSRNLVYLFKYYKNLELLVTITYPFHKFLKQSERQPCPVFQDVLIHGQGVYGAITTWPTLDDVTVHQSSDLCISGGFDMGTRLFQTQSYILWVTYIFRLCSMYTYRLFSNKALMGLF